MGPSNWSVYTDNPPGIGSIIIVVAIFLAVFTICILWEILRKNKKEEK